MSFSGVSPTTVSTPATSALGTLSWQNVGDTDGSGSDDALFLLDVTQTGPSVAEGTFVSTLFADFAILSDDQLTINFSNNTLSLGDITYQVGYLTTAGDLSTFTAFENSASFTLSSNASAGGSLTLYARITAAETPQAVPEPASLAFVLSGAIPVAVGYGLRRRSAGRRPAD